MARNPDADALMTDVLMTDMLITDVRSVTDVLRATDVFMTDAFMTDVLRVADMHMTSCSTSGCCHEGGNDQCGNNSNNSFQHF